MSEPVTREEQLLSAIATGGDVLSPITRQEMYLAYLAGDTSISLPEPVTRKEQFLYQACLTGGSGGEGITPVGTKSITENGIYDVMRYANADVNVSTEKINNQDKTITANGEYTADAGYTGLGTVTVSVPASAAPVIHPLSITENGTYEASDGVDGYSPVTVNVAASAWDDGEILDALITRNITSINNNTAAGVGYASFKNCYKLKNVKFSNATYIYGEAFYACMRLEIADFSKVTTITTNVFWDNSSLYALILRSESICTLSNTNSFNGCGKINDGTGYIYVPSALVAQYQAATNWSTYATQFRALEDYTVDGTITGELDPDKI